MEELRTNREGDGARKDRQEAAFSSDLPRPFTLDSGCKVKPPEKANNYAAFAFPFPACEWKAKASKVRSFESRREYLKKIPAMLVDLGRLLSLKRM